MRVSVLGPFELRDRERRPIPLGGRRVDLLLARLALAPGRVVAAGTLIDDLWDGDAPAGGGVNALQRLVSRARRSIRVHGADGDLAVESRPGGYLLAVAPDEVDACGFERLAAAGRRLLREGAPERAADALRAALELWRGAPLAEFDAAFAVREAARLAELRSVAVEDRAEAELRLGRPTDVIADLDALCAPPRPRERATGLLMRALVADGRRADALAVFERTRAALADTLGADPSPWLRDLHVALLRADAGTVAPPGQRPGAAAPGPVPRPPGRLTRFVGRDADLERLRAALLRSRLVTLFGAGGAGKTRLATEFVAREASGPDAPAWFVELAALRPGADLAEAVGAALGLGRTLLLDPSFPARDRFDQLVAALSTGHPLLVLDNCEHLLDEVARFATRLLAACPGLRVLTTSREPLAVTGEALCQVLPLEVPESTEGAERSAAIRLFLDRAALVRPEFALQGDDAEAAVEICRRLDGLPLAIELAAGRLRAMTARQVADRLDDRFRLLSAGSRAAVVRHRTLRAVLDWSWDLLTENERVLARRLSVLVGAVTEEAATAVCAGGGLPSRDVPYLLASLVEKSLVGVVEDEPGAVRYRMPETTRAYCWERLAEAGERDRAEAAGVRHFLALAERAAAGMRGARQPECVALLDAEYDNAVESLRRAMAGGDAGTAVRFGLALSWYWVMRGRYVEADRWFGELLALGDRVPRDAAAVFAAVRMVIPAPVDDDRVRGTVEAARLARDSDAMARHAVLGVVEPKCWLLVGDYAALAASAERARRHPDPWVNAAGDASLGLAAEAAGEVETAERHLTAALEAFRRLGDRWMTGQLTGTLSGFQSLRGDHAGAVAGLHEALAAVREVGSPDDLTPLLIRLGDERLRRGDHAEAEAAFHEARRDTRPLAPEYRIQVTLGLGELAAARGRPERARELYREAARLLDDAVFGARYLRVEAARRIGALELAEGDLAAARATAAGALELAAASGDMAMLAGAAELMAAVTLGEGSAAAAARLLGAAERLRGVRDDGSPAVRDLVAALTAALGADGYRRHYGEGERDPSAAVGFPVGGP
ncbi:ATP-binding protein [Marinitenerispora sediminis]|uniref:ATP-binding protein n=1 Tax=Marinitenerispora sediminis TaxID=1931232 RepID=UPI0013146075|nr:BTAD domain-containing putative transcriptional regulator [Marinitenerispora sediminis]